MATPLKDRIRAAAIATPALTALLGTNPFRWYDTQLVQGSALPAVVVQQISGAPVYVVAGRLPNSSTRMQFTCYGVNNAAGMAALSNLVRALTSFFDTLNLVGISGLAQYQNFVVGDRDGWVALPGPVPQGNPLRLIDAMIFSNDSL